MCSSDLLTLSNLSPGIHPFTATFNSVGMYAPSSNTTSMIISANTSLLADSTSGSVGSSVNLKATLTNRANGDPIAQKSLDFSLEGKKVGSAVTDGSGVAVFSYKITQVAGKYALKVVCVANSVYGSSTSTATLTVK